MGRAYFYVWMDAEVKLAEILKRVAESNDCVVYVFVPLCGLSDLHLLRMGTDHDRRSILLSRVTMSLLGRSNPQYR